MAGIKGIRFKGHETFTLREGWLNKGLNEVRKNPRVFAQNYGADALGVGPNMAKAIRYWLRCAGLTRETAKDGVFLTDMGELIFARDPYTEDPFTLWLLHCRIASNRAQATAWNLFFNRFGYEEFERRQLAEEMRGLAAAAAREAGTTVPAEKSVEDDCDAIVHMYLDKGESGGTPEDKNVSPFAVLGLLEPADGKYCRKQPDPGRLPEDVVLCLMEQCVRGKKSIGIDELLIMENGPGRLLQLKRNALAELLERLEARGRVTVNRTAGLNMVYPAEELTQYEAAEAYYRR